MSVVLDTVMEYINQALEDTTEEQREDLIDGIIRRLGWESRGQRSVLRYVAADADACAGRELTEDEVERVRRALPTELIAEAFADVVYQITGSRADDEDDDDQEDRRRTPTPIRAARRRPPTRTTWRRWSPRTGTATASGATTTARTTTPDGPGSPVRRSSPTGK